MSETWHEKWCKLWVFRPVHFRGHFEEIGIVKVLLNTTPRRVGKFRDVGFPTSEKVWRMTWRSIWCKQCSSLLHLADGLLSSLPRHQVHKLNVYWFPVNFHLPAFLNEASISLNAWLIHPTQTKHRLLQLLTQNNGITNNSNTFIGKTLFSQLTQ